MSYPGGKGRAYPHVINQMPPHHVYIETHLGTGTVLRNKRPAARMIGIEIVQEVGANWRMRDKDDAPDAEIIEGDALKLLRAYPFEGHELVYADPPYCPRRHRKARLSRAEYGCRDYLAFLGVLSTLPCNVIVSGYACGLYETRLAQWHREEITVAVHRGAWTESLWVNYPPPVLLQDHCYTGATFREREAIRRRRRTLVDKIACAAS
ncbi:MAG: DNA adenine methylase [Rhodobacteraceae bacterium]|nr:DNA adenine methylase [Paracoccaceae bacterium]